MEPPDGGARPGSAATPVRILRIITRLNVGGPAIHTVLLTRGLEDRDFHSLLVTGRTGEHEGDMTYLARDAGIEPHVIPELGRELSWKDDFVAFAKLIRVIRAFRPHIVHTHTAKAGTVGRLAAIVACVPIRVQTFHGHVFHGYFGRLKTGVFLWIERILSRFTHRIVAISERQRDDLCDVYRVAPRNRCVVIPLGFNLGAFARSGPGTGALHRAIGLPADRPLVGIVGRLVPIKNHTMFLDVARRVVDARGDTGFVIVGDGELRPALEVAVRERGLSGHVHFLGWRRDLAAVYADLDVVALTSINEGTPVALIEAMACGRPVVSTRVGGVGDVIEDGRDGMLVDAGDVEGFTRAVLGLLGDPDRAGQLGREGRQRILARYDSARLIGDVRRLYADLLAEHGPQNPPAPAGSA